MGNIKKAIIAIITLGIYVFLLFNGLYDNKIAFYAVSGVLILICYFVVYRSE